MKDLTNQRNWYDTDLEYRKNWYRQVADAYNKARPQYPQKLIDRAVELAQLQKDAIVLELGCGPGTATISFAPFGFSMVCLEPSPEACQLARENCFHYPSVTITNTSFEEYSLLPEKFNAILAANSFHWISPEIRHQKAAAALVNNGSLILLWNTPPQPTYEVHQALMEVYQAHAPSLGTYEDRATQEENLRRFGQNAIDSGCFKDLVSEHLVCEFTYGIDNYLILLSTLSPYMALDPEQRNCLFKGLREVLEMNCGMSLPTSSLSVLQIVKKIAIKE